MLSNHDKLVFAITKIFSVYGYEVHYNIKGKREKVKGNSGIDYYLDIYAKRGSSGIVADIRTRGQRGLGNKIDRGVIQLLFAVLADLTCIFQRPKGMIITSWGIEKRVEPLAEYFGILIITLPLDAADRILTFDVISERNKIMEEAEKLSIAAHL